MNRRIILLVAAVVVACGAVSSQARGPRPARANVPAEPVRDILDAEREGLVQVKYIPNDSRSAQIVVTNKSDKPLTLRLPKSFVGMPVLAQMGMGAGMGGGGMNAGGMGGAGFGAGGIGGQASGGGGMGGGMGGPGGGMGGMGGMGGGPFSIPPQRTRTVRVMTVCLEYGKPEPSPRMPYKLTELESFSSDPKLDVLMQAVGRGEMSQKVAQAAAWHISNGLTWQQLAAEKIDHAGGIPDEPYFTPAELVLAQRVVAAVTQDAATRGQPQPASPGLSTAGR